MDKLSQHPYDLLIHFALCFTPVYFGWATWFVVAFVAVMIEYEQKTQVGYNNLSWREYFLQCSLSDLIADGLGIITGMVLR
jgi:hypothetical protein